MDLRAKLQQWLNDGWTDSETPLDGYGRAIVEEVLSALTARASEEPQGWRPIETCSILSKPMEDRKRILVYGPEFGAQFGYVIDYGDGTRHHAVEGFHGDWKITHWMSLPAPPSASAPPAAQEPEKG